MRLVTFERSEGPRAGIVFDDVVVDSSLAAADIGAGGWAGQVKTIIQQDREARQALEQAAAARRGDARPLSELVLAPPVPDPDKIICIGLNYQSHVEEAKNVDRAPDAASAVPILFAKFKNSLVGHEGRVITPPGTEKLDWEAELAVIIGRRARRVRAEEALDYVGGYAPFNDISARDLQLATPQWTAGKAFDTAGPFGPVLCTADEIPDPQALRIQARLNGETVQDANTAQMIFPVARLIEFISGLITLEPGDVIATGTPAGVGVGRTPPLFMQPGDVIEVEVERLGVLRNDVVGPGADSSSKSHAATAAAV